MIRPATSFSLTPTMPTNKRQAMIAILIMTTEVMMNITKVGTEENGVAHDAPAWEVFCERLRDRIRLATRVAPARLKGLGEGGNRVALRHIEVLGSVLGSG